jgi:hypothetical protein
LELPAKAEDEAKQGAPIGSYGVLLSGPVDVGTMLDAKDRDDRGCFVDLIDDAICTASRGPQSSQFALQLMTDSAGVLAQRPDHELDDGGSDTLRQARELSLR